MERFRNRSAIALCIGLLLATTGCAVDTPAARPEPLAADAPVWPAPPAAPRIRYLRSVTTPGDWGITRSFLRRTLDALAGRPEDGFVRPSGVAASDRVLYVADPGAPAIWILDGGRNRATKVTEVGSDTLASPVAVTPGPAGTFFVADTGLNKVFQLSVDGRLLRSATTVALQRPAGLAYDTDTGELYVADAGSARIDVIDAHGALARSWGRDGGNDGEFNHPTHVTLQRGTVLVNDALNFRIQAFDRQGRFLWKQGHHGDGSGDLAAPKGIAFDAEDHLFIVDALFDAVQIFDRDGTFLLAFGERGTRAGQFWLPAGLFIDSTQRIFVADAYNRRVQVFQGTLGATPEARR